ncbi:MAG: hypothetical protein ABJP66_06590 [Hyphomicrobiales bacterium]|uniref:hypothetical protein n=1 Tax=Shimia thalassica TaxID=1715693 RepID=UPI0032970495
MAPSKGQRKSFLFPEEAIKLIDWLRKVCRVGTDSDVVRLGIGCLADLMLEDKQGNEIIIREKDGTERKYHPVFDLEELQPDPIEAIKAYRAEIRKTIAA